MLGTAAVWRPLATRVSRCVLKVAYSSHFVTPLSFSSILTIMGLSGRVTVHIGTSFASTQSRREAPKSLKIKLNKSRKRLAQEQQKRRIAREYIPFNARLYIFY
jgi:hypothetical protein